MRDRDAALDQPIDEVAAIFGDDSLDCSSRMRPASKLTYRR